MKKQDIKKYIYFPTGRTVWFDLAKLLYEENTAEPVVWIGDNKHKDSASKEFPNAEVLDFYDIHTEISLTALNIETPSFLKCYRDLFSSEVKSKALKMMDRQDPSGAFHYIERINQFHFLLTYSIKLVIDRKPDFLIMCESPHSPFQFILSEVCKWFNIDVISFFSWGVVPLISAKRNNSHIYLRGHITSNLKVKIESELNKYIQKFETPNIDIEPKYIKNQKEFDKSGKRISYYFFLLWNKIFRKPRKNANRRFDILFFPGLFLPLFERLYKISVWKKLRKELLNSSKGFQCLNRSYVYFPLHYEPERTTNPDGGEYYDQIIAIASLRARLPSSYQIAVKEHYSQFSRALQGYKGRRASFYKLLRNIEGVVIVDDSVSSKKLILNAEFTCSITGTAALESALYGKPGVIMGTSWFDGAPGVYDFDEGCVIQKIVDGRLEAHTREQIFNWFKQRIDYTIFGTINPSNERYFDSYYVDEDYKIDELCSLIQLVKSQL